VESFGKLTEGVVFAVELALRVERRGFFAQPLSISRELVRFRFRRVLRSIAEPFVSSTGGLVFAVELALRVESRGFFAEVLFVSFESSL
jgi:surfactin synthase thioesterase subunit